MMVGLVAGGETEEKERGPVWSSRPDSPFLPVSSVGASCELVASQSGLSTTALRDRIPATPSVLTLRALSPLAFSAYLQHSLEASKSLAPLPHFPGGPN